MKGVLLIDGIILVNKPQGFTSFDVVAKMRGICGTRKIGHAGTLDPMASGVLPIFVGNATKACDCAPVQDKSYRAVMRLGFTTDTLDITGKVLTQSEVKASKEDVMRVIDEFVGEITQIPPMYSAVKIGGKKLYQLAREGKTVERPERRITIYSIDLVDCNEEKNEYTIDVSCSKGTYIRTLCDDIGAKLGCGAVMTELTRTSALGFSLDDCFTLEELDELKTQDNLESAVTDVSYLFESLIKVSLNHHDAYYFCNGIKMEAKRLGCEGLEGDFSVCELLENGENLFLGVAFVQPDGIVKLKKLFTKRTEKPVKDGSGTDEE